jgi:glycosyltransferase involved in cell wall biosynthesis
MIPILFTIPNFITAGSGREMLNIVERLDRTRFAPAVCVLRKGGNLDREVEKFGIPFLEAPFTVPVLPYHTFPVRAWRAAQVFRPHRFALWHSFHYSDDYSEPIIARLAGARAWVYTKKNMNWRGRPWYLRTLLATRVAARNQEMMETFFAPPLFRSKASKLPPGVDTTQYNPDVPPRLHLRDELGISRQAVVVGCVAHLVPVKGHPTLLGAIARIPDVHLIIAGKPLDGPYVASLKQLVRDLMLSDRVHFLGDVSDVPGLLAEIDISVLPTWAKWRMEGCPLALLETMACGQACIATDIPGSRDLIDHGKSGLLVPPENIDALAAELERLVASPDLRQALGTAARKRVLKHFTIEREVTTHEALYSSILHRAYGAASVE